ncbi:MAG TPA: LCP family protein [Sporichthyaceae bacterium]|nr:LCP family protein [Sporichthyaceae bacterium]
MTRRGKVVVCGATALTLVSGCAGGLYLKLAGNLNVETINVVGQRPLTEENGANRGQNILVLGSQTREGQIGSHFGGHDKLGTDISDTAMLVHLSADRQHAVVTSIPRDLIVARPDCASRKDDQHTIPGSPADMFDLAMNLGGPSCAVATVEHMSGMRVDHFIRVDFNGFRGIVNAVGGVDVCVPAPGIHDWRSGLDLDPGHHTIRDQEALAFVRDRHGVGDGGDLGRIRMQQVFLSSLAQKIQSAGTLTNPMTLYKLANSATSSLTVDPGLGSIPKLISLARALRGLTTHNITFITAPNAVDPNNPNRLLPAQPGFDNVFGAMAADRPINPADLKPQVSAARPVATRRRGFYQPVPGAQAVSVRVLNATHRAGTAARIARDLRRLGFHVAGLGQALPGSPTALTVGPGEELLKSVLHGPVINVPATVDGHGLTLTVGQDFPGLHQPDPAASGTSDETSDAATDAAPGSTEPGSVFSAPGSTEPATASSAPLHSDVARTADADICSGLPRPRTDSAVKRPDPKRPVTDPTAVAPTAVTPTGIPTAAPAQAPAQAPAHAPAEVSTDVPAIESTGAPATNS